MYLLSRLEISLLLLLLHGWFRGQSVYGSIFENSEMRFIEVTIVNPW
jgi:hypothetical protein